MQMRNRYIIKSATTAKAIAQKEVSRAAVTILQLIKSFFSVQIALILSISMSLLLIVDKPFRVAFMYENMGLFTENTKTFKKTLKEFIKFQEM